MRSRGNTGLIAKWRPNIRRIQIAREEDASTVAAQESIEFSVGAATTEG